MQILFLISATPAAVIYICRPDSALIYSKAANRNASSYWVTCFFVGDSKTDTFEKTLVWGVGICYEPPNLLHVYLVDQSPNQQLLPIQFCFCVPVLRRILEGF